LKVAAFCLDASVKTNSPLPDLNVDICLSKNRIGS